MFLIFQVRICNAKVYCENGTNLKWTANNCEVTVQSGVDGRVHLGVVIDLLRQLQYMGSFHRQREGRQNKSSESKGSN